MTTKDFIMTNSKLEFVPVSKWNEYFTYPSVGAIRQYIFYNTNGFNDYVLRHIGKRLYIKFQVSLNGLNKQIKKQVNKLKMNKYYIKQGYQMPCFLFF